MGSDLDRPAGCLDSGPTIGLDVTAAALMAVAALLLTGVLELGGYRREREAWNTFIWFAVLVMMATFLGQFGLIKWFTRQVARFAGIGWVPGLLGLSLVYFYTPLFLCEQHRPRQRDVCAVSRRRPGARRAAAAGRTAARLFQQPVREPHPLRHGAGPDHLRRRACAARDLVESGRRRKRREYRDLAGDWHSMVAVLGLW